MRERKTETTETDSLRKKSNREILDKDLETERDRPERERDKGSEKSGERTKYKGQKLSFYKKTKGVGQRFQHSGKLKQREQNRHEEDRTQGKE